MADASKADLRKVVAASMIGTTIEWYDFFLYGSAAARWTREVEGADIPVFPTVRAGARALAMVVKAAEQ